MQNTHSDNTKAVAWVVVGMSAYAVVGGLTKLLAQHHPGTGFMWPICLGVLALIAPWALRDRAAAVRTRKPRLHFLRSLFNTASAIGTLYALPRLSLGEVTLYQLTTPIWLIPLALLFLGESVRPMRWLGVAVGFVGVWIVAAPDLGAGISTAVLVLLACAVSDAMLGVLLKQGQSETPLAILWWTYVGKTLLFGLLAGFALPNLSLADWGLVGLISLVSVGCMLCFTIGYRTADATVAETGSFAGLLIGPLAGWLLFGETLETRFWLGAAVLVAGIALALFETRLPQLWLPRRACREQQGL